MPRIPLWRRYLRFFGPDVEADVEDELHFHLETKVDDLVAQGWPRDAARAEAQRQFGDISTIRKTCRRLGKQNEDRMRKTSYLAGWRQDVTFGLRQLRKRWATTLLAVVTLGIGIGSVAAVFSLLDAVVLRPLPFRNPDRIVTLWSTRKGRDDVVTPRNFDSWRRGAHSFTKLAALRRLTFTVSESGSATQIAGGEVTADFFSVFGVSPLFGRTFTAAEDRPPRLHLVVLSHRLWQERFAGDPAILGQQVRLNRESYTVIGVMPARFDLLPGGEQLWIPLALSGQEMNWRGGVLHVFGRLRPGVTLEQARAEMAVMARNLQVRYPEMNRDRGIAVHGFASDLIGGYRRQLLILLAAVGFVFLIACANVANLLLARGAGRSRELTIRAALGATRSRIVRQLLTESLLLAFAGAALGLFVADSAIRVAKYLGSSSVPRLSDAGINLPVLLAILGMAFACALLCGMLPALRAARVDLQRALGQSGRSSAGLARDPARNAYTAAESALAFVLLIAAGLLIRTAVAAQNVQPGFNPDRVIAARTALPETVYKTADQVVSTYRQILHEIASQPGVQSAALSSKVPLSTSEVGLVLKPNAVRPPLNDQFSTELQYISPGYFATMGIPLLRGREFNTHDHAGSAQVAVVNEALARRLWPDRNPIGQMLRLPDLGAGSQTWEVVGMVANAHEDGLVLPPPTVLYVPFAQVPINPWHWTEQSLYLVARTRTQILANSALLESALKQVDSQLPLGDVRTMNQRLAQSVSAARFYTLLLSILGLCGLLLTGAGIYGVVAYFVSRQRAEIGIRIALGATRGSILLFVVRQGMRPVVAGIAAGVVVSLAATRALASELYGVGAMDPITFVAVGVVLFAAAALACYVPARQAARVDPMVALRSE